MNNWHLIFDTMSKIAAELCLEDFERNGCKVLNVQCLGEVDDRLGLPDIRYKWLFVLNEPIDEKIKKPTHENILRTLC